MTVTGIQHRAKFGLNLNTRISKLLHGTDKWTHRIDHPPRSSNAHVSSVRTAPGPRSTWRTTSSGCLPVGRLG